jgi:Peptidase family S51
MVRETDALLVWGGDVLYLCYWMRQSGLADLLPSLSESVYVGVSAGSIVMTPYNCDAESNLQYVPAGSDQAPARRKGAGVGRFRVARTSGSRGLRGLLHGQRRKVGLRNTSPDVRDRRSDRYQSGRRCGRSRLRRELETVYPRPGSKLLGLRHARSAGRASSRPTPQRRTAGQGPDRLLARADRRLRRPLVGVHDRPLSALARGT